MTFVLWFTAEECSLCSNQQQKRGEKPRPQLHLWLKNVVLWSSSVRLTHLETFTTLAAHLHTNTSHSRTTTMTLNHHNLNVQDLKPPIQPGASKGLLHNRNSHVGLRRPCFCCGQTDKKETRPDHPCSQFMPSPHAWLTFTLSPFTQGYTIKCRKKWHHPLTLNWTVWSEVKSVQSYRLIDTEFKDYSRL